MFISGFSVLFWWSVCLWRCHIILSPYDTALNYCSFAVSLKSGHASPTNLFFFKIVSVWDPLHFLWLYFTYNLFSLIYFWPYWVLIAACRLSLVWVSGGTAELQCSGFSLQCFSRCGPRALGHSGSSSCVSQALELRLSSCGAWAQSFRGIFLEEGSNPCLQNWQADSLPLDHQGSPHMNFRINLSFLKKGS